MKRVVGALSIASCVSLNLFGAGYKVPEQSLYSVAMSGAGIASADSADASYYNPAKMSFMSPEQVAELGVTYIYLPPVKYDTAIAGRSGESKTEKFVVPTLHYVGPKFNDFRFGLSVTAPAGLSKRWDSAYQKTSAEEFTLKVVEINPTVSYKVGDNLSLGLGLRGVHSEGVVKSNGVVAAGPISASRDMTGSSMDYGYNVALTYKPTKEANLALTYRSKVDLTVEGDATLTSSLGGRYSGGASVTIPLPATLDIAASYEFGKTTVELVYERTYWSAYKELDFNYASSFTVDPGGVMRAAFDNSKAKNWKDSNTYRLGLKHRFSDKLDLMAGFAIDKTPVPDDTLGFELPDSNGRIYSCGAAYRVTDKTTVGVAYLYADRDERSVVNSGGVNGSFTNSGAHLARFSVITKF